MLRRPASGVESARSGVCPRRQHVTPRRALDEVLRVQPCHSSLYINEIGVHMDPGIVR
jgi:hypothetical protein